MGDEQKYPTFFSDKAEMDDESSRMAKIMKGTAIRRELGRQVISFAPQSNAEVEAQRQSWVRGMTARCEHGEVDFEQCPQCRARANGQSGKE